MGPQHERTACSHAPTLTRTLRLENSQLRSSGSLPWEMAMKMDPLRLFALVNAPVNLSTWRCKTGACLHPIHYPYRDRGTGQAPSAVVMVILGKNSPSRTNFHFYFFTRFQREAMGRGKGEGPGCLQLQTLPAGPTRIGDGKQEAQ